MLLTSKPSQKNRKQTKSTTSSGTTAAMSLAQLDLIAENNRWLRLRNRISQKNHMNPRDKSKENFESNGSLEHINASSLQRIADATELMAKDRQKMIADLEFYKKSYYELVEQNSALYRKISALKGVVTKLKRAKTLKLAMDFNRA